MNLCESCKNDGGADICNAEICEVEAEQGEIIRCEKYEYKKNETKGKVTKKVHKADNINSPLHYMMNGRETIETIKDVTSEGFEGYLVGNIVKYISRYKYKNGAEDLNKAAWYLNKLITEVEK